LLIGGPTAAMAAKPASADSALALLRDRSLASAAQEEIEKLILSGELPAGARIGEAEMALRLGISRGPVREAFRGLEEVGLVRFEKNRGVFVREIDLAEADQNYVVRGALEALAARLLAGKILDEEIAELRGIIEAMAKAIDRKNYTRYTALNHDLHRRIIELAGNAKLLEIYSRITKELMLFRRRSLAAGPTFDEHREIVERLAARDPEGASRAVLVHVEGARQRMLAAYAP